MRLLFLRAGLLYAIGSVILTYNVCCSHMDSAAAGPSDTSWRRILELAHESGVPPSTYSSDAFLSTAAIELDRAVDLLNRNARLNSLITELRHHEPPVFRSGSFESRQYQKHTIIDRVNPIQFTDAIKQHFKSSSRKIALLNENTVVTSIAAKKPYSPQIEQFALNGADAHVLFWDFNAQRTELRFIGLAVVSPPTLVRTLLENLPKLSAAPGRPWDSSHFQFLPPDGIRIGFPLVLKP